MVSGICYMTEKERKREGGERGTETEMDNCKYGSLSWF